MLKYSVHMYQHQAQRALNIIGHQMHAQPPHIVKHGSALFAAGALACISNPAVHLICFPYTQRVTKHASRGPIQLLCHDGT